MSDQLDARVFNAVTQAMGEEGMWLPLSARKRAADAALAVIRQELKEQAEWETRYDAASERQPQARVAWLPLLERTDLDKDINDYMYRGKW